MEATILLVEDDRNQRLLYEMELSAEGYDVVAACDGKEAIEKAETQTPDLIVMDIAMPNMDGIEALGKILAKNGHIPIILNTAYQSYKDNFMTWAADAYIVKSSDMRELRGKIVELLEPEQAGDEGKQERKKADTEEEM